MTDPIKLIQERWDTINESVQDKIVKDVRVQMRKDIRNLIELVKAYEQQIIAWSCDRRGEADAISDMNRIKKEIFGEK